MSFSTRKQKKTPLYSDVWCNIVNLPSCENCENEGQEEAIKEQGNKKTKS